MFKKLNEYKGLIADAKGREGRDDPELMAKLRDLESEAKSLEREINDVDAKMNDLKPSVLGGVWEKNLEVRPERDWENLKGRAVVDE